jgi:hypothetical protein
VLAIRAVTRASYTKVHLLAPFSNNCVAVEAVKCVALLIGRGNSVCLRRDFDTHACSSSWAFTAISTIPARTITQTHNRCTHLVHTITQCSAFESCSSYNCAQSRNVLMCAAYAVLTLHPYLRRYHNKLQLSATALIAPDASNRLTTYGLSDVHVLIVLHASKARTCYSVSSWWTAAGHPSQYMLYDVYMRSLLVFITQRE